MDRIEHDWRRAFDRLPLREATAMYVEFTIGKTSDTEGKRKSTAIIGKRRFYNLGNLEKFLHVGESIPGEKSGEIDWSKRGMCPFGKRAGIFVTPSHPRKPRKVIKRYRLES